MTHACAALLVSVGWASSHDVTGMMSLAGLHRMMSRVLFCCLHHAPSLCVACIMFASHVVLFCMTASRSLEEGDTLVSHASFRACLFVPVSYLQSAAAVPAFNGCKCVDGDLTRLVVQREAMPTLSALSQRPDLMHLSLSITGILTAGVILAVRGAGAAGGAAGAAGAAAPS